MLLPLLVGVLGKLVLVWEAAGGDGVDTNVVGRPFLGDTLGEAHEPSFGGVVGGAAGHAPERSPTGDVYHRTLTPFQEMGAERAAALERLGQVKVDDAMPVFLRHGGRASVGQRGYRSLNGVTDAVDQHVEMAEFGQHLLCQQVHVCGLGGVPVEGQALPAHRPDFLGYCVGPDGRQASHCHVGPGLPKGQRNALADASSRTYTQDLLARNVENRKAHVSTPYPIWTELTGSVE